MNENNIQKKISKKRIFQLSELCSPYIFNLTKLLFLTTVLVRFLNTEQFKYL